MESYRVKECARCDGHGVLFEDDGTEPECPECYGEGDVPDETK